MLTIVHTVVVPLCEPKVAMERCCSPVTSKKILSTFADIKSLAVSVEETYFMIDTRVTRMVNHCPSCLEEYSLQTISTKGTSGLIQLEGGASEFSPDSEWLVKLGVGINPASQMDE